MLERPAGFITFSLPIGSTRPEEGTWFENIIPMVKQIYREDKGKVVDMAELSREEVILALDTWGIFKRDVSIFL